MKAVLNETKRILAVMLSVAMIIAAVPQVAFANPSDNSAEEPVIQTEELATEAATEEATEPQTEPVEEPAPVQDDVSAPAADGVELAGGDDVADDSLDAVGPRTIKVAAETNPASITGVTYGGTVSKKYAVTVKEDAGFVKHSNFEYYIGKLATGKKTTDADDLLDGSLADMKTVIEEKALPTGLSLTVDPDDRSLLVIGGTAKQVVDTTTTDVNSPDYGSYYLVVRDKAGVHGEYSNGGINYLALDITVGELSVTSTYNINDRVTANKRAGEVAALEFGSDGRGTDDDPTNNPSAKAGYTVLSSTAAASAKYDNVHPIKITLSNGINPNIADTVKATITEYDGTINTNTNVKSGTDSSSAFTVSPAESEEGLASGQDAVFTVKPARELACKDAGGTTYWATLTLSSKEFKDKKYTLKFIVMPALAISDVTAHGGNPAAGDGNVAGDDKTKAYDLGTFKIGEQISDVEIDAEGGYGDTDFVMDTTTKNVGTDPDYDMSPLPTGLTGEKTSSGVYKITGMITTAGLAGTYYFGLTPKDEKGITGSTNYFKYTVTAPDVEMFINSKEYNKDTATKLHVTGGSDFGWGGTADKPADDFATIYINNKSGVDLTFAESMSSGTVTGEQGKLSLDATTEKLVNNVTVAAGQSGTIKVYPNTLDTSKAIRTLTLTAAGLGTATIKLTYTKLAGITITKPSKDNIEIGPAKVGEDFTYLFEAGGTNSIAWQLVSVEDTQHSGNPVEGENAVELLAETYGMSLLNNKLSGIIETRNVATRDANGYPATFSYDPLKIKVRAVQAGTANHDDKTVLLTIDPDDKGLTLTSGGTTINKNTKLNMGTITVNDIANLKTDITVTNTTKVDQTGIMATVLEVNNETAVGEFLAKYDEDPVKNADITTNGMALAAKTGSRTFSLVADPALVTAPGRYVLKVAVEGPDVAAETFTANLVVTDEPVIDPTFVTGIQTKVPINGASGINYTTTYAGGTRVAEYSLVSGSIPGLSLDKDGYWTGTATKAGKYKVTVSATTTDLDEGENATGTLTHEIVVTGNADVSIALATGGTDITGKTYVLPGEVKGYAAKSDKLQLKLKAANGSATLNEDADGIKVTVTDAKDDRSVTELNEDGEIAIIADPTNPYKDSSNYFTVGSVDTTIKEGKSIDLNLATKANAQPGVYKATVNVEGTNFAKVSFDVLMVVADKFEINPISDFSGEILKPLTDTSLVFSIKGGYDDQRVQWSEKGTTNAEGTDEYYITKAGTPGVASDITKLTLSNEGQTIGADDEVGIKTNVTGTPLKAGTYTVNVGAKVGKVDSSAVTANSEFGIAMKRVDDLGITLIDNADAIPEQTAADKSFSLTIGKSTKPKITELSYGGQVASSGKMTGTITGQHRGLVYTDITKYEYEPVGAGYDPGTTSAPGEEALLVTVTGSGGTLGKGIAKFGEKYPKFTVTPNTEVTIADPMTYTIIPNEKLAPGTYHDVLTISGENFADITLDLTFVVEEETYLTTIDNDIKPDEKDAAKLEKRVEFVKDMSSGTGAKALVLPDLYEGETPAVGDTVSVAVRNTGNTELENVDIVEVVKSGNTFVKATATNRSLDLSAGTTSFTDDKRVALNPGTQVDLPKGKYGNFKVNSLTGIKKGGKAPYLEISYGDATDDSKRTKIYLPVTFSILNKEIEANTISVSPTEGSTGYVTLTNSNEGYSSSATKRDFVITNNNTKTATTETLKNMELYRTGVNADAFDVIVPDDDLGKAGIQNKIPAGGSLTASVVAKEGLPVGTYTAVVTFMADNQKDGITRTISFTVNKSSSYTFNQVTTDTSEKPSGAVAEKLYNTIWHGLLMSGSDAAAEAGITNPYVTEVTGKASTNITPGQNGEVHAFDINLDGATGNLANDIRVTFTGTADATAKRLAKFDRAGDGVVVTLLPANSIKSSSKNITLTEAQQLNAVAAAAIKGSDGKAACYPMGITFNLFATVKYGVDADDGPPAVAATKYAEDAAKLTGENVDVTANADGKAEGQIITYVPIGSTAGSVFTNNERKLPTAVDPTVQITGWKDALTKDVVAGSAIFADTTCTPKYDVITYPIDSDKDEDKGLKWTWTYENGSIDAVLELTDISGKYDKESLITITKSSDVGPVKVDAAYPAIAQAVVIADNGSVPATCTKGSRQEYAASAQLTDKVDVAGTPTVVTYTYTSTYSLDEQDDAKGHVWSTPSIDWDNPNADGTYNVTYKCSVCGEKVIVKATAKDDITLPATCNIAGTKTTTLTWNVPDKFGKTSTVTATDTKDVVIAPLGHDYKLIVEWNEDHRTAKTANLVCQRQGCAETEPGHTHNVLSSVEYTITENADGTVGKNVAKVTYDGKDYTEEWIDDVLYNPQVEWIDTFPLKWYKGTDYPTMKYNVVVTSKKKGTQITISGNTATVASDPYPISANETEATFTATADLSDYFTDATGETRAQNVTKSEKYYFKDGGTEGISDVYYAPQVEWIDAFPAKWTKRSAYPTMTYKVTYTSKRTGEKTTLSGNTAVVTSDPVSIPDTATEATFIATADLSQYFEDAAGTKPAKNVTFSQKYVFPNGQAEGYARDYKYKSHHFTWPTKTEPMATPNVKVKVTYSVTENKKTLPDETISGNAIMSDGTISGNYISFTAKVNTFDGLTKFETQKYNIKTGKLYEGQETPAEPEQPENKTSVNLFYTNADKEIISLQLPDGADVKGGSGKWTTYYDIDESGTVTVKAPAKDLSKAAKPANSVITIPVKSASGNEIGQFSYSLPVYYQKPKLKLTSTSGTVNTAKGGETTLVTTVTEKKSSGAFEKMSLDNLADDGLKYNAKSGSVVIAVGDEVGEITLTTSAKASGKISIQLENWVEPMELSYTVKATNKNVLTSDKKQVIFNLNSYDVTGANPDSQSIELFVNGEPAEAGALTLVKMPNGWDASGLKVADGCIDESSKQLTDSTLTFEYSGTKPANKSKTYSFQFKTSDNKKITVKAQMSKLALANKALTYKTQTKMNLSTGQRMVLIPQFKGVTGEYEDVKLASGDEKTFELEPDYERGQVYLAPADGVTLSSKTQYTPTIEATVGGVPVTTQLKFKPQQSNVTVKIDKVTVPKTKMEDGTMEAEANVLCTYKQGGKTFTTAPNRQGDTDAVTFMIDNKTKAPAVGGEELDKLGLTDGWYKIDKANVLVKYEASTGTILVRPTGKVVKPKNGTVKVWLNFNGKIVKKNLSVKIDKKK